MREEDPATILWLARARVRSHVSFARRASVFLIITTLSPPRSSLYHGWHIGDLSGLTDINNEKYL